MSIRLTHDFAIGGLPRILRQQPQDRQDQLGADQIILPTQDSNNSTTATVVTQFDVLPGESIIFMAGSRAGTPTGVVSLSGVPSGTAVEIISFNQTSNSTTANLIRAYFPNGMAAGTSVTLNWDQTTSKKAVLGWRYKDLANQSAIARQTNSTTSASGAAGTTQGITSAQIPAVHVACFTWGGAAIPQTAVAGVDEEGTVDTIGNVMVGTSAVANFFAEQRRYITGPHTAGMTFTATASASSTFSAVQAVWSCVPLVVAPQSVKPRFAQRRVGPPILLTQKFPDYSVGAANQQVDAPAATATASSPAPLLQLTIPAPVASATASAPVPVPQLVVPPAAATANASAPTPTVQVGVIVPLATASANGPPPVLPIAVPAATASASAPVPTMPIKVVGNTIILGYSNQSLVNEDIPTLERGIGRKFSGLRQNQQITTTSLTFANNDFDAGHAPASYRSIQLSTGLYTDINAGTWDTNLTTIANNIISSGRWSPAKPFIITFMHEVGLSSNDFLGTSQQYINAFRYIRDLFDSLGATVRSKDGKYLGGPIIFSYVGWNRMFTNGVVDSPDPGKSYTDYDPDQGSSPAPAGTTYYTLVGSDPYNQIVSGSLKYGTDAATMLDDIKAQAVSRGKDWMIGELGCEDGGTPQSHLDKAAWLDSVHAYLAAIVPTNSSGVCRYLFSTQEDGGSFNWDSSLEALAAGKRLALDPYFVQNSATAFGPTPEVIVQPIQVSQQDGRPYLGGSATRRFGPPVLLAQQSPDFSTPGVLVSPPVATATASAPVPTIQIQVPAPAATASVSAPVPPLPVSAPTATASASAPTPSIDVKVPPPVATASASAPVPTPQLQIPVPVATANASAPTPGIDVKVSPAAATASASAPVPVPQLVVLPPVATASASAPAPTVTAALEIAIQSGRPFLGRGRAHFGPPVLLRQSFPDYTSSQVSPPAATASASSPVPVPQLQLTPPVGTANASSPVPVPQLKVLPSAATASASAPLPTVQVRLTPAAATANASAPTPVPQVRVIVPAATASASAIPPIIGGDQTVTPPVATANASAKIPGTGVGAPRATASASARVPRVSVVMINWPQHSGLQWPPDSNPRWGSQTNPQWGKISGLQWPPDSNERW